MGKPSQHALRKRIDQALRQAQFAKKAGWPDVQKLYLDLAEGLQRLDLNA